MGPPSSPPSPHCSTSPSTGTRYPGTCTCGTPCGRRGRRLFPPPRRHRRAPPPAPQVSSTRLIKVVKKPVGSQHSFSNLDGARASIDSADRPSISSEGPEEVEPVDADEE